MNTDKNGRRIKIVRQCEIFPLSYLCSSVFLCGYYLRRVSRSEVVANAGAASWTSNCSMC
jgi:hypothetical protein